eukprot:1157787-Pelagomonas_calceolata.AAC.4
MFVNTCEQADSLLPQPSPAACAPKLGVTITVCNHPLPALQNFVLLRLMYVKKLVVCFIIDHHPLPALQDLFLCAQSPEATCFSHGPGNITFKLTLLQCHDIHICTDSLYLPCFTQCCIPLHSSSLAVRCEVKVIDLGSSCFTTDQLSSYVQSRSYRAPEVILGLPYDQKVCTS